MKGRIWFTKIHFSSFDVYISGVDSLITSSSFKKIQKTNCKFIKLNDAEIKKLHKLIFSKKISKKYFKINGTDFQKAVWTEIKKIPYGKTLSYKELAIKIKRPKACRAVANACGKNPLPVFIPCHRVVASNSKIGGFSGGIEIKRKLLKDEHVSL